MEVEILFIFLFQKIKRLRTDSLTRYFRRGTPKKNPPCLERID